MKPRGSSTSTTKVDIAELTPEPLAALGQAAYFELGVFLTLAQAVSEAPSLLAKEDLSLVAGVALAKHHALGAEIRRKGGEPADAMAVFAERLDEYRRITRGADWYELLVSCYLTTGLLEDFFTSLSAGLPGDLGTRVERILKTDDATDVLVREITAGIAADPKLGSRLAMWGRRLVGDTLLIARSAMHVSGDFSQDESLIEPVFTEMISAHTRRMDAIGLTA